MNAFALHAPLDGSGAVRWGGSAAIIVALHAALIAAGIAWYRLPPPPGSAAPTILVTMAPVSSAPEPKQPDAAPGPPMQQADPTPPPPAEMAAPQPEQPIPATPPQDRPVVEAPPEQKPQPLLSEPPKEIADAPKPLPAKPKPVRVEAKRPSEKPTPRTSAAPKAERQSPAVTSTVDGATAAAALASYRSLLSAHLQRFKQYPASAKSAGEQGTSMLSFTVGRNGRVLSSRLARSSGHASLDTETLDLIRRAQPLPSFPPEMKQASMSYTMAIPFSLR